REQDQPESMLRFWTAGIEVRQRDLHSAGLQRFTVRQERLERSRRCYAARNRCPYSTARNTSPSESRESRQLATGTAISRRICRRQPRSDTWRASASSKG